MSENGKSILVVEDSDVDFDVFLYILEEIELGPMLEVHRAVDVAQAVAFLEGPNDLPSIILLDLNLPGQGGRDLLQQIKQDERFKLIPVIVVTTSNQDRDVDFCYRQGANSYLIKQVNLDDSITQFDLLLRYWFSVIQLPGNIDHGKQTP